MNAGLWFSIGGLALVALIGLGLLIRRLREKRSMESMGEEILSSLRTEFPFEKYVGLFGPLHWETWLRKVEREPAVHAELQALLQKADADPRLNEKAPIIGEIVACVRRHPTLQRRVELEYKIQIAHMFRQVLFRKVPYPESKGAEWRAIYEKLRSILPRAASPDAGETKDYYLVSDQVNEPGHKIELSNPDLLTPEFLKKVQGALIGLKNEWYVILQLDFDQAFPDALPAMLTVWKDHVDEAWDKDQLRSVLGPRFKL